MADRILTTDQLLKELDKYKFNQLHIHHTWKPTHRSFNGKNHLQLQENMRTYHIKSRGWKDIGHHLALMPDGSFVTGRPFNQTPASIRGWNAKALGLEIVGNFDIPGTGAKNDLGYDKLEGKQKDSVLRLIKYFGERFGYQRVVFHREGPAVSKTCPGTSLNKATLIAEAKKLGQPPAPTPTPTPTPKPSTTKKKTSELHISGQIVKDLQTELNRQFKKGLKVDGYFGDLTIAALVTVRKGAKGNITRIIQRRLISLGYSLHPYGVDGKFGELTQKRITELQRAYRLPATGIVDRETWKVLFRK